MEQHLQSMIVVGAIKHLPKPSTIIDQHCELFKSQRVTGILLCGPYHFMAVLEGQALAIQSAIKQTIAKPSAIHTLYNEAIPRRSYRYWNMHISEQEDSLSCTDTLVANLFAKLQQYDRSTSKFEKVKNLVSYYYCEYIVKSHLCEDYRLAKIA